MVHILFYGEITAGAVAAVGSVVSFLLYRCGYVVREWGVSASAGCALACVALLLLVLGHLGELAGFRMLLLCGGVIVGLVSVKLLLRVASWRGSPVVARGA